MASAYDVENIRAALQQRSYPTVTLWNRLEARPRTANFDRALRAEVRDALWMLTRQWQTGEFQGEDAGSPTFARVNIDTTRFTQFCAGDAQPIDFDDAIPLEAQVERQPLHFNVGSDKIALDLRLIFGQRWLKMVNKISRSYAADFIARFPVNLPDPSKRDQAAICAHPEVWQSFAAVSGRAMDGVALYQHLLAGGKAYDGISGLSSQNQNQIDRAATKFVAWVDQLFAHPESGGNPAWQPSRLEYRFGCVAPTSKGKTVYTADQYYQGWLDWYNFSIDADDAKFGSVKAATDPRKSITRSMIPVPVSYAGMPNPRWWTIEDGRTNFGDVRPDTTDLAKLLFIEFGLVYSNDWYLVPFTLTGNSIATVGGLAVTNVFGENFWIGPASGGSDDAWQRWSMFTVNITAQPEADADPGLLFLPTVVKVQEGPLLEEVMFIRDEMANMAWAIEKTIPAPDGRGKSGATAATETRNYHERLVASALTQQHAQSGSPQSSALMANDATIRYDIMSSVPENWIPFIPAASPNTLISTQLQRASMKRLIDGDLESPVSIKPRTTLLRVGLDAATPQKYFIPDEEVPRAGIRVAESFKRTRWQDGRAFVWLGVRKETGRGEGWSGLAFDRLAEKK